LSNSPDAETDYTQSEQYFITTISLMIKKVLKIGQLKIVLQICAGHKTMICKQEQTQYDSVKCLPLNTLPSYFGT
jgi:hypothetical protein